ncbi:MAG: malto-oligosyltrehalose trehalohydrolase [Verrucomicrobiota bacterium]
MHTFCVWAPLPKRVEVRIGAECFPMSVNEEGGWTAAVAAANPGSDYGFILDGQGPFPDPRSPWQPQGIDGPSRLLRHADFKWTDANWQAPPLSSAVIYECHVGTFTPQGTFGAVIEKLDYLAGLGVTHLELMPVNEFSGARGWGYDGVDLCAPHHTYGGPEQLKRLVDACHAHRLAVLLDVVYNHVGPVGNYLGKYAPYFSRRYSSPWGGGLNFDGADCGQVRRFFCDNALMWLRDYHFDGLRLDAVHGIVDASAIPFLEQLAVEVEQLQAQLNRPLVLIPESDLNDPRLLWGRDRGGFGLHAQWSDDFHHALHSVLTGEKHGYYSDFGTLADVAKALTNAFVFDGGYSAHRRRPHGRPPTGLDGRRFVGYIQNHDQVGNRAQGERSSRLMGPGRLKIAAALVMTSPFIPLLFQGEEWGAATPFLYFTDHQDPALGRQVREGRRRELASYGWNQGDFHDPQARKTFEQCKLDWSEPLQPFHAEMLDWHRRLIDLRRTEPAVCDSRMTLIQTRLNESEQWLLVERPSCVVACNLGGTPRQIQLSGGNRRVLMSSPPVKGLDNTSVTLAPDAVAILKLNSDAAR